MRLFYTFLLITAAVLFGTEVQAQTLPCGGGQVLTACDCFAGAGTIVADVATCDFSTATNQGYILVDAVSSVVTSDADDGSIVEYSTTGTFSDLAAGDYLVYYLIYDVTDAAMVESFLNTGSSFADLLSLATQSGVGEWVSTSPSFSLSVSSLATVNADQCSCIFPADPCNCSNPDNFWVGSTYYFAETITINANAGQTWTVSSGSYDGIYDANGIAVTSQLVFTETSPGVYEYDFWHIAGVGYSASPSNGTETLSISNLCSEACGLPAECDGFEALAEIICGLNSYTVVVGLTGAASYNVTSSTGGLNGTVSGSFSDGPFALGTSYNYTVSDASNAVCALNLSGSNITCVVTSVELISFDGRAITQGNELLWSTGSEDQSDFFTVERSTNGVDFTAIGTVKSAGNSSITKSYSFLDTEPKSGVNYYRLAESSTDGKYNLISDVISIESTVSLNITNIFPVPASDMVNIEFDASSTSTRVELFDITGQLITAFNYSSVEGANLIPVQIGDYAIGTYFITISNGVESSTVRFVKSK